MSLYI